LRNINDDNRIGMLFLFPGLEVFLRINGQARISRDETLLLRLQEHDRTPKTAVLVTIDEVFLHCGKAVNRAKLWRETSRIAPTSVPSLGEMKAVMTGENAAKTQALDADYYRETYTDFGGWVFSDTRIGQSTTTKCVKTSCPACPIMLPARLRENSARPWSEVGCSRVLRTLTNPIGPICFHTCRVHQAHIVRN
jgi:hypothetical protein